MTRVLSVDPGAERCGWAILESGPTYIASGMIRCPRGGAEFQKYRLRLEYNTTWEFETLFKLYDPLNVINEIIPAVGGGNFVAATQSYLASCVVSVLHVMSYQQGVRPEQIGATTVQSKVALKGRSKGITKVQVRNGVVKLLPELLPRVPEWVKEFDEVDAIAIGLAYLGYTSKN